MKNEKLAQARHSACEELVYRALWGAGREQADGRRIATLSQGELALKSGRHQRTVERSISRLIQKGSIEVVERAHGGKPTRYSVYPYREILRGRERGALDKVGRT
jgi:hypothetical protein